MTSRKRGLKMTNGEKFQCFANTDCALDEIVDKSQHRYAVIMAGGTGMRLWPLSRKSKPKQFQALLGDQSLLQRMYDLLIGFIKPNHILIQAPIEYIHLINEQIPSFPEVQLIIEPEARDTAPAFALAAAVLNRIDPDAILGIFYSDNVIADESRLTFYQTLANGYDAALTFPEHLIVVGVRPLYAHTGLGYIELGARATPGDLSCSLYYVKSFVEKPQLEEAKTLVASARYLWNTGYKISRSDLLLRLIGQSDPTYAVGITALTEAVGTGNADHTSKIFCNLPRQSFEYLVAEESQSLMVIASDVVWSDVGDWEIIYRVLVETIPDGPTTPFTGKVVQHECENTLLISQDRPIVAIGVRDLVVIETKDVVLVMSKGRSQEIKVVLERLLKTSPHLE